MTGAALPTVNHVTDEMVETYMAAWKACFNENWRGPFDHADDLEALCTRVALEATLISKKADGK